MGVPIYFTEEFLAHSGGAAHPERPERVDSIRERLGSVAYRSELRFPSFEPASRADLERVHTGEYLESLEQSATRELTVFDADTSSNSSTWAAARLAAGAAVAAVDRAFDDPSERPFVNARPPGHHAEADRAMGFCFINNAAVAAAHALAVHGASRVAVVDWDVHHGNGTERIFLDRADVFYASLHQYPHYPGTGRREDRGVGAGTGYTINVPLPAGSGDEVYLDSIERIVVPALEAYAPELVIVSAGFDADARDPLAQMQLTSDAYRSITRALLALAERVADGRIVHLLEGGYDLDALADGVDAVVSVLAGVERAFGGTR